MCQKKTGGESVIDAKKLKYPILPFAKIHTLRIGDLQFNPYMLDDKNKYFSLNAFLDVTISAAWSSQNKRNDVFANELIKQILRK